MPPRFFATIAVYLALVVSFSGAGQAREQAPPPASTEPSRSSNTQQLQPAPATTAATGDLSVSQYSDAFDQTIGAGQPITYTIFYEWEGDAPAPNVRLTDQFPSEITISSINPAPTSQSGGTLSWDLGSLDNNRFGVIEIKGVVRPGIVNGTVLTNNVTIAGDVTEENTDNNVTSLALTVQEPRPNLIIWKFGLFEEMDAGNYAAEQNVDTTFELYYFNFSNTPAPDATLVDELPAGVEFVSADPAPSSVDAGGRITWNLGPMERFGFGQVKLRVRPTLVGDLTNTATISTSAAERDTSDNSSSFQFKVVPLLQPRLLKPNQTPSSTDSDNPVILGTNPKFQGLAKAGATVTLYEGPADGCYTSFEQCDMQPLASTTAAADRTWELTPPLTDVYTYSLYLRAEKDGLASEPDWGYWEPLFVRIDPRFEQAGFDMDNFVIGTGDRETRPGGVGGSTGTTPDQDLTIKIRQKAPNEVASDPQLQANHDLKLVVRDGDQVFTETVKASQIQRVGAQTNETAGTSARPNEHFDSWDFIYVHKGFGPGSVVEIWCLPVAYTEDGFPLVGLVYVKCHEILIDPAGYVYDVNKAGGTYEWPEVPPSHALITNATVTATVRVGDTEWARWDAERTGQVNPQVTDRSTPDRIQVPGYFAFYVPAGQYQVVATAPECIAYISPVLTVVDAPVFHNVGMRCTANSQTGVDYTTFLPLIRR